MTVLKATKRRGRPQLAEAEAIQALLVEHALNIFLLRGFEQTTMEEIAKSASISKRTLYSRFKDKTELFNHAISKAIDNQKISPDKIEKCFEDNIANTLFAIAKMRFAALSTSSGIRLQRIIATESYRFPELLNQYYENSTKPTIDVIAKYLAKKSNNGEIKSIDTTRCATQFITLALGSNARLIAYGHAINDQSIDRSIHEAIELILHGILPRTNSFEV